MQEHALGALEFYGNIGSAISERGKDSANWRNFQALGGASSGYISSQLGVRGSVAQQNKPARKFLRKAGEVMSYAGEYTESMFRFAEYLQGVKKYGDTPEGRRKAIGMASDVTVNFSRSGPVTKAADSMCLYLNANVQGLDKMARTIARHPVRTVGRGLALAGVATLLRYAFDHDDNPHYQNLTNYVKDNNFLIPNALGKRDENGYCTTFIKLPKSREYGVLLAATLERCCRFADGEPFDEAFADLGEDIKANLNVSLDPFWSPIADAKNNKNFFGSNIVPSYMERARVLIIPAAFTATQIFRTRHFSLLTGAEFPCYRLFIKSCIEGYTHELHYYVRNYSRAVGVNLCYKRKTSNFYAWRRNTTC